MNGIDRTRILAVIAKLPAWVRRDLNGTDGLIRERANEALAAIVIAVIE